MSDALLNRGRILKRNLSMLLCASKHTSSEESDENSVYEVDQIALHDVPVNHEASLRSVPGHFQYKVQVTSLPQPALEGRTRPRPPIVSDERNEDKRSASSQSRDAPGFSSVSKQHESLLGSSWRAKKMGNTPGYVEARNEQRLPLLHEEEDLWTEERFDPVVQWPSRTDFSIRDNASSVASLYVKAKKYPVGIAKREARNESSGMMQSLPRPEPRRRPSVKIGTVASTIKERRVQFNPIQKSHGSMADASSWWTFGSISDYVSVSNNLSSKNHGRFPEREERDDSLTDYYLDKIEEYLKQYGFFRDEDLDNYSVGTDFDTADDVWMENVWSPKRYEFDYFDDTSIAAASVDESTLVSTAVYLASASRQKRKYG